MRRHPLLAYFVFAFGASAAGLAVLGLPSLHGGGERNPASLAIFPLLILGVAVAGLALTAVTGGRRGLAELRSRLLKFRAPARIWAIALLPPFGVLTTLLVLRLAAGLAFAPGLQLFGIPIGMVAGYFEEIGWTGFAYPRMRARFGAVGGAILLGFLWGLWHFPVVDSLGAASPHGPALPAYSAAFVALVMAVRCLVCWAYLRTGSVLVAQVVHASFTGSLILFSAPHVTAWQEAGWYAAFAALLWLAIAAVALTRIQTLTVDLSV